MNAHETTTHITKMMDHRNGWEIPNELENSLETTLQELMYGDPANAETFLRDLARTLENAADNLN